MPGTYTPGQMFDHELNPRKGWPSPYAVDYAAEYASGETTYAFAGRVASLDANGRFELGLSSTHAMAIFLFQNYTDFDVRSDVGNISGERGSGLVAIGTSMSTRARRRNSASSRGRRWSSQWLSLARRSGLPISSIPKRISAKVTSLRSFRRQA